MKIALLAVGVVVAAAVLVLILVFGIHRVPVSFRVVSAGSSQCGLRTCHLIGVDGGHVYGFDDESWLFVQVGHCYQARVLDDQIRDAREIPCGVPKV